MAARRFRPPPLAVALAVAIAALVAVRLVAPAATTEPSTDGGGAAGSDAGVDADSERAAAVARGLRFTDVTREAGLYAPHSGPGPVGEEAMTSGAAVADVDADGDLDLYLTRVGRPAALLLNDGTGRFDDVTDVAGVPGPPGGSSAPAFADVDADGDLDLYVTAAGADANVLYRNDGDGTFTDATAGSGLDDLGPAVASPQMHGATFGDPDRDGDLDLLVTHWDRTVVSGLADGVADAIEPDEDGRTVCPRAAALRSRGFPRPADAPANRARLYLNDGTGRFRDASVESGLRWSELLGFTGSFADVDGDGWDDLLVTGDFCTSRLYRNTGGGRFADVTDAAGVGTDENGMGSVVRDVDGDGDPDWLVTSIGPVDPDARPAPLPGGFGSSGNRLWLNDGDGTFTDATDRYGVRAGGWGWGAAIEDWANDGRLGVVMTNGYSLGPDDAPMDSATDPLRMWLPDPDAGAGDPMVEVSAVTGLTDTGIGHGLVPFDMDRDGDLDLLVANGGAPPVLYRNDTPARHWLGVRLDDPTTPGNRAGIGARVVVTPEGGAPVTTWVRADGSYESQVPAEVHVGLGEVDRVARVEVTWPGAAAPQVVEDVAADQVLVVTRPTA